MDIQDDALKNGVILVASTHTHREREGKAQNNKGNRKKKRKRSAAKRMLWDTEKGRRCAGRPRLRLRQVAYVVFSGQLRIYHDRERSTLMRALRWLANVRRAAVILVASIGAIVGIKRRTSQCVCETALEREGEGKRAQTHQRSSRQRGLRRSLLLRYRKMHSGRHRCVCHPWAGVVMLSSAFVSCTSLYTCFP